MYNQAGSALASGSGAGVLAYTGAPDLLWMGLAGFAMIALGSAVLRIVPKLKTRRQD